MSGIGGVFIKNGGFPHQAALDKMLTALNSRGRDGAGTYSNQSVGLVHTRLNITDADTAHQPMIDIKERAVVFDGEIYNSSEIRRSLQDLYPFKTTSDAETILALYDTYGIDFIDHLRGMYAIALYDPAKDILVIARDPFGIKPLYLTEMPSHTAFASEPKALIQSGYASDALDIRALRSVVTRNYIGNLETPYPAIQRVQAGERIIYERGVRISSSLRPAISHTPPRVDDETTALLHLEKTLLDSIDAHCRSDAGYGVFLSGDVNTAIILQVLSMLGERGKAIQAYTTYFEQPDLDNARAIAKATNADLQEIHFGRQDFVTLLPQIAGYMDAPIADLDILPTWKMASIAAKEQKIILCGEGADELFGGHHRYRKHWWTGWRKPPSTIPLSPHWSQLQCEQAKDIAEYLPNRLLPKLDSCLMGHGLEGRTPFLDAPMADFAFTLPDHLKIQGRTENYLLKKWLDTKLPAATPFGKRKPSTLPVGEWLAADAENLSDIMVHHPLLTELLTKSDLALLPKLMPIPEGAKQCWPLVYLALWYTGKQKNAHAPNIVETLAS